MSEPTQRRLAAIVSVDVVGYSRLMGADEAGTLATYRTHRSDLIDPLIETHNGRIVKTMGDGLLLEFPSVVAAVECAIAIQNGIISRNTEVAKDIAIRLRIGVHLGDVVVEKDDIFGDGVNVAARLEAFGEADCVTISGTAYENIAGRIDAGFIDLGDQTFKNIARPVRVWQLSLAEAADTVTPDDPVLADKPSIAVLPFDNMSSDAEQEYFADGIAEDIITELSKISRMRVIARNSTFAYKGKAVDLRQVASELGVRYILEGSIRSGGNRLRITAQLIDATDASHLWAERFDRTIDDIFDIQDEITKEIVTALRVKLTDGEQAHFLARGTNDIQAWQYCVHATELFLRFTSSEFLEARSLAEKAVERDPNYAYAWATLGFTYWWDGRLGYTGDTVAKFARAREYAERAMALDDTVSMVIGLNVMVAASQDRFSEGVDLARRGFSLHPGNADIRAFLAFALVHGGGFEEAVDHFRAAMALNPFYPNWCRNGLARSLIALDKLDEALAISDEILSLEPSFVQAWVQKAYIFNRIGRSDDAGQAIKEVMRLAPNLRLEHIPGFFLLNDTVILNRLLDGLREAGLPE
ncbi:MAG: adenylate/guanylate cyclase domain-containing protein, partial [Rhodospirillaceae bacterium]|nr:adenylate/guanylate cyclase domain-containing protein [Rhodospirillaceae bacterium]